MGRAVLRGEMKIPIILGLLALGILPCTSANSAYNTIPISLSQGSDTEISSPDYPNNYDNNLNILWVIQAPDNFRVVATFSDVSLEYYYDNLVIGFGSGPDGAGSAELAQFTGSNYTSEVVSPGNTMWIVFTSDVSKGNRGFQASLTAIAHQGCQGDEFQCRSGLCISPAKICDGYNDCLDFSDEDSCPICEPVQLDVCRERLAYNTTFFPHRLAGSALDAETNFTEIVSGISSCHQNLMSLTCNMLFPECTHNGPTQRVCYSDCVAVTNACQDPFEQTLNRPWPFNCSQFTDDQADGGLCFAAEGDLFNTNICGTRPAYSPDQSRVVGGINARRGEFPWIGSLKTDDGSEEGRFFCGASLIAPQWVLTAAHCVEYYVDRVTFGNIRLSGESEYEVNAEVADIIAHPDYSGELFDTDIALLRLTEPVTFNDYVRPVCLATSSDELNDYRRCVVAGWGATSEGGDIPETLRKAVVNLLDQEWCDSEDSYNGTITDNMICAGYERGTIDTCQGDSGGPLTCEGDDGRWHLVGATSFGDGCARPLFPGVYVRISQFQSFITAVVSGAYLPGTFEIDLVEGVTTSITSPNYPTGYDVDDIIVWKISAPVNRSVRLDVVDLSLEQDYDFLYVGNGLTPQSSTELARMTGYVGNRSVTSHGRHMWVRFVSDYIFPDVGFEVELRSVDPRDDNPIISVVDNVNPVQISSPNYPANYPTNSYDIWRIVAPANQTVLALILDVDLGPEFGTLLEIGYGTSPHSSTILYTLTAEDFILGIISSPNNAMWIRFQSGSQSGGRGFAMQALAERLEAVNECGRNPCSNGGTCTDLDDGYQCSCLDGYKGDDCTEDNDECEFENPCFNGGTCNNGFGNFSCECPQGYTGLLCETILAVPCDSNPCLNGATCADSGAAYICRCPAGYTGQNCESSVTDPCQSNPCSGAAICEVYGSNYRCVCRQGFTGYNCDIDVNECSSLPCQNGGRCINGVGRYTCQCRLGYSGVNCQQVGYCDLEGEWYNDCNDKITIVKTSTGLLLGDYLTNEEILAGSSAPTVVVGYANQNKDFPTFGFLVGRNGGVSTTSWSGQCQLCDGEEVLYTTWTNTRRVNTCSEIKRATRVGQDKWTRYRQDIAPRRDV